MIIVIPLTIHTSAKSSRVAFRKKIYADIETLQKDLDTYLLEHNTKRTHQGKRCQGRTTMEPFIDCKILFDERNLTERMAAA